MLSSGLISLDLKEWLVSEGLRLTPDKKCVCSPINLLNCTCSSDKINFKISFVNYETANLSNNFEISASAIKLEGCDIIIGFPTIQKYTLIVLQCSKLQTDILETSSMQHTGKNVSQDLASDTSNIPNIRQLIGGVDDKDDLSEMFYKEAPWEIGESD